MADIPVHDRTGKEVGTHAVDPADFAGSINKQLLHDVVVMYEANQRQGSHQTKTRAMVSGSTHKLYRQKGTGNARAGSRRSGIRRGGGHIFAIKNRDYSFRLNKKSLRAATRMAIAGKLQDEEWTLVDDLSFSEPKTKEMHLLLKAVGWQGESLLICTPGLDGNAHKSARNIPGVTLLPASDVNAYALLKVRRVIATPEVLDSLKARLSSATAGSESAAG